VNLHGIDSHQIEPQLGNKNVYNRLVQLRLAPAPDPLQFARQTDKGANDRLKELQGSSVGDLSVLIEDVVDVSNVCLRLLHCRHIQENQ